MVLFGRNKELARILALIRCPRESAMTVTGRRGTGAFPIPLHWDEIGRAVCLRMNSSVRERTSIGTYATIGMGAALVGDVPPGETWVGAPANANDREAFSIGSG